MTKKRMVKPVGAHKKELKQIHAEWDLTLKKQVYGHAPEDYHFHVTNGEKIQDMNELLRALQKMDDASFTFHVNAEKNDFSTWVKDVFKQGDLAAELKKATSRTELELVLHKFVNKKLERLSRKLYYQGQMR